MNINLVAIDLAKSTFHVRGVNHAGQALFNGKVSRERLLEQVCKFPAGARIAMEACGSSHYWGRAFMKAGYEVVLIAPQYVKPFVKTQKNDCADAEGIAEAASRATMRFVPVKSVEQQDIQAMHRVRERHIKSRTALMNELRGLLGEYGVVIAAGRAALAKQIPLVLESGAVTETMKELTRSMYQELTELELRLKQLTNQIEAVAATSDTCRRLMTIPGVAELTATALYASLAHMNFKNGRELAAFVGLVPRQRSTGGKERLGRITKQGDKYLRKLLVHGARSVLLNAHRRHDRYHSWAKAMRETKGYAKGAVAVANRNARVVWAIMSSDASFEPDFIPKAQAGHHGVMH